MYGALKWPIFVGPFLAIVVLAITFALAPWQAPQSGFTPREEALPPGAEMRATPPDATPGILGGAAGEFAEPDIDAMKGVSLDEAIRSGHAGTFQVQTASLEPTEGGTGGGQSFGVTAQEEAAMGQGRLTEPEAGKGEEEVGGEGDGEEPGDAREKADKEAQEEAADAEGEESGHQKSETKEGKEDKEEEKEEGKDQEEEEVKEGNEEGKEDGEEKQDKEDKVVGKEEIEEEDKQASDKVEEDGKAVSEQGATQDSDEEAAVESEGARSQLKLPGTPIPDEDEEGETPREEEQLPARATNLPEGDQSSTGDADSESQDSSSAQGDAEEVAAEGEQDSTGAREEDEASPASRPRGPRGKFLRPGAGKGKVRSRQPRGGRGGVGASQEGPDAAEQDQGEETAGAQRAGEEEKEEEAKEGEEKEKEEKEEAAESSEEGKGEGAEGEGGASEGGRQKAKGEGLGKGDSEKGDEEGAEETNDGIGEVPEVKVGKGKGTKVSQGKPEELARGEGAQKGSGERDTPDEEAEGGDEGKATGSGGKLGEKETEEQGEQATDTEAEEDAEAEVKALKKKKEKEKGQGAQKKERVSTGAEEEGLEEATSDRASAGLDTDGAQDSDSETGPEDSERETGPARKRPQGAGTKAAHDSSKQQAGEEETTEPKVAGTSVAATSSDTSDASGTSDWVLTSKGEAAAAAAAADMLVAAGPASAELATEAADGAGGGNSSLGVQETEAVEEKVLVGAKDTTIAADSDKNEAAPRVAGRAEASGGEPGEVASAAPEEGGAYAWASCGAGREDWVPCLDNEEAIQRLRTTKHYEHRERHCPARDRMDRCLPPLPRGYQRPIAWPESRDMIWFSNVPHPGLAEYKKKQNWVRVKGDKLVFPGGGTQFVHGAGRYIDRVLKAVPEVAWGIRTRVMLDVGCGVASLAAYLEPHDVRVVSLAPKDEHEAQVQLALERGILALLGVMGTQRLPFPAASFDAVHCSRCRVPWHKDDGILLLEVNRVLRPGGYFVWSATPVYRTGEEDTKIWDAMADLASRMCWTLEAKEAWDEGGTGLAAWKKPSDNRCYRERAPAQTKRGPGVAQPPMCEVGDKRDAAWYVPMTACIHALSSPPAARGADWPLSGRGRLAAVPGWLKSQGQGLFGKPIASEYGPDLKHWMHVTRFYGQGLGIEWAHVRNVMDANAKYGGFAAALAIKARPQWVLSVVPVSGADTLPIIFERGLPGVYHDWCEPFNTYPRTYDLLHLDHLLHLELERCDAALLFLELDRILRPGGWLLFRERSRDSALITRLADSLHWDLKQYFNQSGEELHVYQKTFWRP